MPLFDLDGTLIDSRRDLADSVNALLADLGHASLPPEQVMSFVGRGARSLIRRALIAAAPGVEPPEDDATYRRFLGLYDARLLNHTHLYAGVREGLDRLRAAGAPMAVVTNKPIAPALRILDGLGVREHFGVVLGGDSVAMRKPNPEMLHRAAQDLGVPLSRCVVIGDSDVDLEAAEAASLPFLWCSWGGIQWERPSRARHVARSFDEVVSWVFADGEAGRI